MDSCFWQGVHICVTYCDHCVVLCTTRKTEWCFTEKCQCIDEKTNWKKKFKHDWTNFTAKWSFTRLQKLKTRIQTVFSKMKNYEEKLKLIQILLFNCLNVL